jgi:hypothetical protein
MEFIARIMFELSWIFIVLAIALAMWDRFFWLLGLCFPSVKLFKTLQLPDLKWWGRKPPKD